MAHTIPVSGYTRRRNVPEKMKSILGRLGIGDTVKIDPHDRQYVNRREHYCPFGCPGPFTSQSALEGHIRKKHPKYMGEYLRLKYGKGGK